MDLCTVIELPSKLYKGNNWCNHSNYLFIQTSKAVVCQAFANWAPKIAESSTPGVCQWKLPLPSITVTKNIKFLRFWDSSVFVTLYFVFFWRYLLFVQGATSSVAADGNELLEVRTGRIKCRCNMLNSRCETTHFPHFARLHTKFMDGR